MFKNLDGMGVLALSAHLVVTLAVIILYAVTTLTMGHADQTLTGILLIACGYWFGAVKLPSPSIKKESQEQTTDTKGGTQNE